MKMMIWLTEEFGSKRNVVDLRRDRYRYRCRCRIVDLLLVGGSSRSSLEGSPPYRRSTSSPVELRDTEKRAQKRGETEF